MHLEETVVCKHDRVSGDYRLLVLESSRIASEVKPGQFVHMRIARSDSMVLRRPFSVFKADNGRLAILYKSVGRGTRLMQKLKPGDPVNLMGPLGNGFPLPTPGSIPVLVAGGYGSAGLFLIAKTSRIPGVILIGGATEGDILCRQDFIDLEWQVEIATEDGSLGHKGLVTDMLDAWLEGKSGDLTPEIYACGPDAMLRAVCRRTVETQFRGWLSLDRHMGCGAGACLGCVQRVRNQDGKESWARVCREGPVFECRTIVWE